MTTTIRDLRPIDVAGREDERIRLTAPQLDTLSSRISGPLLFPGNPGWDESVTVWNAMMSKAPALVVQPTTARDVAEAVRFARDRGLLLSIKGGGHNIAGTAIADHGMVLDMARMRDVQVDPRSRLAVAGAGCLLRDVDQATQAHGLATPLGFVSETGLAGLTLGGGWGYLTRRFGWTVDNLEEVEIVTADGEIRIANREENPDLFWAVRGGGGNFGVVTRFVFRLHEVGPTVMGGMVAWSAERADAVLAAYHDLTASAPRELTAVAVLRLAPPAPFVPEAWHGRPIVAIQTCYSGKNAEEDLAGVRAPGKPIVDVIQEKPYTAQQSMLDAMEPQGLHRYWKTEFLPGLSKEFLSAFRQGALEVTSPLSQSVIFHLGGALNERAEDDGAVDNRAAHYVSGFSGTWQPGPAERHVAWVRQAWERIRPFSTGGNYVNFQLADDDDDRTASAYGRNYERLRRVKADYDPGNLFRVNRNILPAG